MSAALLLALLSPLPEITVVGRDAAGCGQVAVYEGGRLTPLEGQPRRCVRAAFAARLEPEATHVVMLVEMPPDLPPRRRLFIYTLEGHRLAPRMLGTGPKRWTLIDATRAVDALRVLTRDPRGARLTLRCRLEGFPLLCAPHPGSPP